MILKKLTRDLSVGPQPSSDDIAEMAKAGYKSLIGNRPDGEAEDQPTWAALSEAGGRQGMQVRHIPVVAGAITETDVAAFRDALLTLPRPVAAFCRTGTRSTMLWALANPESLSAEERIKIAADAGYDLEPLRSRMERN
jgi:uncharacterized protein (TIGR01244 family)